MTDTQRNNRFRESKNYLIEKCLPVVLASIAAGIAGYKALNPKFLPNTPLEPLAQQSRALHLQTIELFYDCTIPPAEKNAFLNQGTKPKALEQEKYILPLIVAFNGICGFFPTFTTVLLFQNLPIGKRKQLDSETEEI